MLKDKEIIKYLESNGFESKLNNNIISVNLNDSEFPLSSIDLYLSSSKEEYNIICEKLHEQERDKTESKEFQLIGCKDSSTVFYAKAFIDESYDRFKQKKSEKAAAFFKAMGMEKINKGLDSLGLSQSSIIRLAMTRLFKSSEDINSFLTTLAQEAENIVFVNEYQNLKKIKNKEGEFLLDDLIFLLWDEVVEKYMEAAWDLINIDKKTDDIIKKSTDVLKVIEQLQNSDPKQFRLELDALGLSRSSFVRLSLTRIFRNCINREEFTASIKEEAGQIVNKNEWEDLKYIKTDKPPCIYDNLITLLWDEVVGKYIDNAWDLLQN